MTNTTTIPATKSGFSATIRNLETERESVFAGELQKIAPLLLKSTAYGIMFFLAGTGYMLLPGLIAKFKYGCEYKTILNKSEYKTDQYIHTFYTYDDGYQAWDNSDYDIGDVVCVKK